MNGFVISTHREFDFRIKSELDLSCAASGVNVLALVVMLPSRAIRLAGSRAMVPAPLTVGRLVGIDEVVCSLDAWCESVVFNSSASTDTMT